MGYASWSVVFGEQPSAAKWNILGTNDSSFNDGTGIGTNAIAAASLATTAITLGYAQVTADQGSITAVADLTSLSATVTVPSGSRRLFIIGWCQSTNNTVDGYNNLHIYESTTQLTQSGTNARSGSAFETSTALYMATGVSTGSHTYKLRGSASVGTMTMRAASTYPAFIWVGVA